MARRVAVLEAEDLPKWDGYTEPLWKGVLGLDGDSWQVFQCHKRQYPTVEEAAAFDCIVITGSHYNTSDPEPWIAELAELLPPYAATGTRIIGCCFGCQLLAVAFGGTVGQNRSGRFVLGVETVSATSDLLTHQPKLMSVLRAAAQAAAAGSLPHPPNPGPTGPSDPSTAPTTPAPGPRSGTTIHATTSEPVATASTSTASPAAPSVGAAVPGATSAPSTTTTPMHVTAHPDARGPRQHPRPSTPSLRLYESHGNEVLQLPPGARLLATSPTAAVELWAYGTNVIAFQFHIELDGQLMYDKIWPAICGSGHLSAEEAATSERQLLSAPVDTLPFLAMLQHFIAHGLEEWPDDAAPGPPGTRAPAQAAVPPGGARAAARASGTASTTCTADSMQVPASPDGDAASVRAHAVSATSTPTPSLPGSAPQTPSSAPPLPPLPPSSRSPPPLPISTPPLQPPSPPPSLAELSLTDLPLSSTTTQATPPAAASSPPPTLTPAPPKAAPSYFSFPFPTSPFNLYYSSAATAKPSTSATPTPAPPPSNPAAPSQAYRSAHPPPSPASSSVSPVPPIAAQLPTYYEQKQQRQQRLDEAVALLAAKLRGALHAGLLEGALGSELLLQLNQVACGKLDEMADVATAMADFAAEAGRKHGTMKASLAQLGEMLGPLQRLEQQIDALDAASRTLARQLGVPEDAAG